jgi:hypothetical protein
MPKKEKYQPSRRTIQGAITKGRFWKEGFLFYKPARPYKVKDTCPLEKLGGATVQIKRPFGFKGPWDRTGEFVIQVLYDHKIYHAGELLVTQGKYLVGVFND